MRVMLAGLSGATQYVKSLLSFNKINKREGDETYIHYNTRGDVARSLVCNKFLMLRQFDALLMCDLDQLFPEDMLERFREHDLDMVSAHYMKRKTDPMQSIWQVTYDGSWPYVPILDIPESGLHRIAVTGLGAVLIKREAIEAVVRHLPPGSSPFEIGKIPELTAFQGNYGSDYRFFYYAQQLGYELWGDADVDTPHASLMWLSRKLYNDLHMKEENRDFLLEGVFYLSIKANGHINLNALMGRKQNLELVRSKEEDPDKQKVIDGQLSEVIMWIGELNKVGGDPHFAKVNGQAVKVVGKDFQLNDLPVFKDKNEAQDAIMNRDKAIQGETEEEAIAIRNKARQKGSMSMAAILDQDNQALTHSTQPGEGEFIE